MHYLKYYHWKIIYIIVIIICFKSVRMQDHEFIKKIKKDKLEKQFSEKGNFNIVLY